MGEARPASDGEWLRSAVRDYEQRLVSYAVHLLGDADRGRDVAQETFMRLCSQPREQIEPRLGEWLFTVCRNLCIDVRRKERRMNLLAEGQAELQVAGDAPPHAGIEQEESLAGVMASLASLSPNQQEVIRLKFQDGLSYKQIAEVTHLTVTNVGFLIHTGLKNIRQRMAGEAGTEKPHGSRTRR